MTRTKTIRLFHTDGTMTERDDVSWDVEIWTSRNRIYVRRSPTQDFYETPGPAYLVLLVARSPHDLSPALVLYEGIDKDAARAAYDDGVRVHRGQGNAASPPGRVVFTTCQEETKL